MSEILRKKILTKKAHVAVIGLGYVGLPLAVSFAKKGYKVYGIDADSDRVHKVNRKENYIVDIPSKDLSAVVANGKLMAKTDFSLLKSADVIIICVPTPIKRKYTPDISFMLKAVRSIAKYFKPGTLIILESTTYPGTTEEMVLPELEKSGLKLDQDFFLAFSPERIDPGNKKFHVTNIPKVVGGLTESSGLLAKCLYGQIIKTIHLVSSAKAAEMTKLLENSFRIVNIGWINEAAMMCHRMGIDIWEVIEAAKTKPFGFMPFYPGLGVGGHCIPEDPLYLYWKAKHHGFSSKYLKLSSDINSHMPSYAVHCLAQILKKQKKELVGANILIVGVTYKKDVKDLRKSPPLRLIENLQAEKCRVHYYDPLIPYLSIGTIHLKAVELTEKNLQSYDCVVIATDHSTLDYGYILKNAKLIYDIKNVFGHLKNKNIIKF